MGRLREQPTFEFDVCSDFSLDLLSKELQEILPGGSRFFFDPCGPGGGNTCVFIYAETEHERKKVIEYLKKHQMGEYDRTPEEREAMRTLAFHKVKATYVSAPERLFLDGFKGIDNMTDHQLASYIGLQSTQEIMQAAEQHAERKEV
jgi:hypothetical protein